MKKIVLFIALILVVSNAFSQIQVRATDCSTVYNNEDTLYINADEEYGFRVFNAHATDLTYKAILTQINLPADALFIEICTAGVCATPTEPIDIGSGVTIAADSCDPAHVNYISNGSAEDMFVRLKFVNINDANDTASICIMYDAPEGIENTVIVDNRINIAPNPVTNQAFVTYDVDNSSIIELFDINGRLIQQFSATSTKNEFYMNTSYLSNGVYMLKIGDATKKFAVIK